MNNLLKDVSKLTTIDDKTLSKLVEKILYCISNNLMEEILADKQVLEIDIIFGTLYIKIEDEQLKYKFVPNETFEDVVVTTILKKKNTLENTIALTLCSKLTRTYKDLL